MTQSRSSYTYNPDIPTRKWHKKWINPMISLQNAPPTSHGTPAPTKEDGEIGHAGFRVHAWIPLDEDDDVPEEKLQEDIDWWGKPGAPKRPEARAATASVAPVVEETQKDGEEDVMQIDRPNEPTTTNKESTDVAPAAVEPAEPAVVAIISPTMASPTIVSPKPLSPQQQMDTEMLDAPLSPVHISPVPEPLPSLRHPSPPIVRIQSPSPYPPEPLEATALESPPKSSEPTIMEDIVGSSKQTPPSDPLTQAREVAVGLIIETPAEQAEHMMDAGSISGIDGGIAGEGIVSSGTEDLGDTREVHNEGMNEERTSEKPGEETKDLESEMVKDDVQELSHQEI
jgi:hypothetical protein